MIRSFFSRTAMVMLAVAATFLGMGSIQATDANNPDTVERQVSLVFMKEMDYENEKEQSPAAENWDEADPLTLHIKRFKNDYTLSYNIEIIDPEPLSNQNAVDKIKKKSRFKSNNTKKSINDSISFPDYCKDHYDQVMPGTEPGRYRTRVHCLSPFKSDVETGRFYVSKLDAHGDDNATGSTMPSTRYKFPDYTQCLPKRKGTVYDPVIQIDKGGVKYTEGKPCLYGIIDIKPISLRPANKWQFTVVAKDPVTKEDLPFGFDYRWTVDEKKVIKQVQRTGGSESKSFEQTVEATYGAGRFFPKLEVWKTHERTKDANGNNVYTPLPQPVLVSKAEIHSLAVEKSPTDNVPTSTMLGDEECFGTRCIISNDVGGSGRTVDAKLEIIGGAARGRVSLDGYPQNEYWASAADNEDLYQVVQCIEGANKIRIQGYNKPSSGDHDLTLKVFGQAFIEVCIGDYVFEGFPVTWSWSATDSEPFMSSWMVKVPEPSVPASGTGAAEEPEPPVIAATGSTVTVRFEKYVDINPPPTDSTGDSGGASDLIRFIQKGGGDVTQTLADYLASQNNPETRKDKIAITAQRYTGNILELELEIGPYVKADWYHADANWGANHAYAASDTVYGGAGSHRMKEVLNLFQMGFALMSLNDLGDYRSISEVQVDNTFAHSINEAGGRGGFGGPPEDSTMATLSDPFSITDCTFIGTSQITLTLKSNVSDFIGGWVLNEVASALYTDSEDSLSIDVITPPLQDDFVVETVDICLASTTFGAVKSIRLHETSPNSNVFTSLNVRMIVQILEPLSNVAVDTMHVSVSSNLNASAHSGQLVETGPDTGVFLNDDSSLSMTIVDGITQGATLKEDSTPPRTWMKAMISSTVLGVENILVDAIEISPATGELRTDALHNHGAPDRTPGALNALTVAFTAVIGKKEVVNNQSHWVPDATKNGPARFRSDRNGFTSNKCDVGAQLGAFDPNLRFVGGRLMYRNQIASIIFSKATANPPPQISIQYAPSGKITVSNVVPGDKIIVDLLSDDGKQNVLGSDCVRLVDVVLKVGEDIILPDKYAYIDSDAVMPRLKASILPQVNGVTVDWRLEITYRRSGRNDHDDFPTNAPRTLNSDQEWDIVPDLGTEQGALGQTPVVRGGQAILTFEMKGKVFNAPATGSYPFRIRGKNPTIDQIRAFSKGKPWYLLAIAKSETKWASGNTKKQHFNENGATNSDDGVNDVKETPNAADNGDGGFGLMQLTKLISGRRANKLELWSWKENVNTAQSELAAHRNRANIWMYSPTVDPEWAKNKGQRVQARADEGHDVPVTVRNVANVTFRDGSARTIEDAVAMKMYNSASKNYCAWRNRQGDTPGDWVFDTLNKKGFDYVERVCLEAEGDTAITP